jgi:hypothetical protein
MKSHDLNLITLSLAQRHGITYGQARSLIGRHGAAARHANRRRTESERLRASAAREREARISP